MLDLHIIKLKCEDKPSFMWHWHRCLKRHFVVRFDAVYFMGDTIITQTSGQEINWNSQKKKLLGSFMLLFHISDIKDFQVPCHATVNALVLGLFLWRKKNTFSSSTLTLVTEGFARDEKYIFIQWFVVKFILSIGQVISRTPAISRII